MLRLISRYGVIWLVTLVTVMAGVAYVAAPARNPTLIPSPYENAAPLANKLLFYRQHKSEYDLILLGDSLTYTGLHPEFIDPLLGTHSINLAIFAHWFATQYPLIKDLTPLIPRGTRVLWSIHNWDFDDNLTVQRVYPVGIATATRYWLWGAHNPGLLDNLLYYDPLTRFTVASDEFRGAAISFLGHSFGLAGAKLVDHIASRSAGGPALPTVRADTGVQPVTFKRTDYPDTADFAADRRVSVADTPDVRQKLTEYYTQFPFVVRVAPAADRGSLNSVVLYLKGGGYYRIELQPGYFREKQQEDGRQDAHPSDAQAQKFNPPQVARVSLKMFRAALEEFRKAGIPVTVNMMEEAPYKFGNEIIRRKYRESLDAQIGPIVKSYGDDYVHADYGSFTDYDYFDYNHFNSRGIAKFTPLLVQKLRETPAFRNVNNSHD